LGVAALPFPMTTNRKWKKVHPRGLAGGNVVHQYNGPGFGVLGQTWRQVGQTKSISVRERRGPWRRTPNSLRKKERKGTLRDTLFEKCCLWVMVIVGGGGVRWSPWLLKSRKKTFAWRGTYDDWNGIKWFRSSGVYEVGAQKRGLVLNGWTGGSLERVQWENCVGRSKLPKKRNRGPEKRVTSFYTFRQWWGQGEEMGRERENIHW